MSVLLDDLHSERAVLIDALSRLDAGAWDSDSPAEGWTLRDCVVHLAETDESATRAVLGTPAPDRGAPARDAGDVLTAGMRRARALSPAAVLAWYRHAGDAMLDALRGLPAEARLPWAGRPMSARSFATARLMEHWSHGLDILEAAGIAPVDTDRLRHVAHLGYITRDFAYRTRGLVPPASPLYVELIAPSGAVWRWGPDAAPDRISGPAGDFCRVVTQRIHPSDTALVAEGAHAREFLSIAQAFAGPPGKGRPAKAPRPP
jgi:uncharacterized protein (TIGR03084 family)